ncbi:hypothetical protein J4Q44_G00039250 [Coregonus suidteri]|uniref:Fibronectin type-III domain-containing protein n=1 Tax=Coregonus suidteri TaxID=861788 RepID=A0AAN8M4R8_9TELE
MGSYSVFKTFDREQCQSPRLASVDEVLPPPGEIQFLSVTSDSVSLSWGSPEGLTGPQKFSMTWGCDGEERSLRVEDGCNIEIDGLQPGKKYQFSVATEGEDGSRSRWVSKSVFTVVPAPRDLQINQSGATSFTVSWSKAEGMEKVPQSFLISYCRRGTEPRAANTEDCYRTLSGLLPGTQYTISVSTVLNNGKQSKPLSTTICTIIPAPVELNVDSVNTTSAAVSWSQPPGLDQTQQHYQISYHCPETEPHITTTVSTVLNNGEHSEPVSATICTVLPAPDQLNVDSVDTTSAAVSWSQPPGLDQTQHHYQISYHCPGTEPHITTTSSHSITLSDLQCGTQYSVTVCTVLENGIQSQLVSTTFNTNPAPPGNLVISYYSATSAKLIWDSPDGMKHIQHHFRVTWCDNASPCKSFTTKQDLWKCHWSDTRDGVHHHCLHH